MLEKLYAVPYPGRPGALFSHFSRGDGLAGHHEQITRDNIFSTKPDYKVGQHRAVAVFFVQGSFEFGHKRTFVTVADCFFENANSLPAPHCLYHNIGWERPENAHSKNTCLDAFF